LCFFTIIKQGIPSPRFWGNNWLPLHPTVNQSLLLTKNKKPNKQKFKKHNKKKTKLPETENKNKKKKNYKKTTTPFFESLSRK